MDVRSAVCAWRLAVGAALLVLLAGCARVEKPDHAPAMQQTLSSLRTAVAKFRDDNGRGPYSLEELVPRYITKVPVDAVTNSTATWRLTTEESVLPSADFSTRTTEAPKPQIIQIHSGAPGTDANGKRWSDY